MQGVIYDAMKDYIVATMGRPVWEQVLARLGRPPTHEYQLDLAYSDAELGLLAAHAAQIDGRPLNDVLEGFGEAIVPMMFTYYGFLADPRWSYVDFLLNMEPLLHAAMHLHTPGALPTKIHAVRTGPELVTIVYTSPLHACAAVRGIIRGAAVKYGTEVVVTDDKCVVRGDPECVITVHSASY
jgi:heme-NO-binding protein